MKKHLLAFQVSLILLLTTMTVNSGESSNGYIETKWQNGSRSVELRVSGTVEFSDDDRDVMSLSPGGCFSLKETRWWFNSRRYKVNADSSGQLSRFYSVDGQARQLDNEGRAWLRLLLPEVIRETGAGAGARVQRILRERGPAGVLAEIRIIRNDESKRVYLEELIRNGNLDPDQLYGAMRAAKEIGSDKEKSKLLSEMAPVYLKDGLREALFGVVDTVSSDDDHRHALSGLLQQDSASRETLLLAVRSAARISSDDEKAGFLVEAAEHYKGNEAIRWPYFKAANSISSDDERRHVLSAILSSDGSDHETLVDALQSAAGISSDEEKAGILIESCRYFTEDDTVRQSFFKAANSISSDEEHARVLSALAHGHLQNADTLTAAAKSAKQISSDTDKAKVLVEMASEDVQSAAVRPNFFAAVNSISSDEEHGRVLSALAGKSGITVDTLAEVAASAQRISSDEEKAKILVDLAPMELNNDGFRAAFFRAADSISSDEEHGRVLSSLLKRRDLSSATVIDVVQSNGHLSSDEVKGAILKQVLDSYGGDPAVRAQMMTALEGLQSNDQYRELMSALVKRGVAH
jgi:hypothetical protein